MEISISEKKRIDKDKILDLYRQNKWSSADRPDKLLKALENSHSLISAREGDKLVGLANSISDGYLVVYYPHLLILPAYQGKGIGKLMMTKFQEIYSGFHQQILVCKGLLCLPVGGSQGTLFATAPVCLSEAIWLSG